MLRSHAPEDHLSLEGNSLLALAESPRKPLADAADPECDEHIDPRAFKTNGCDKTIHSDQSGNDPTPAKQATHCLQYPKFGTRLHAFSWVVREFVLVHAKRGNERKCLLNRASRARHKIRQDQSTCGST